MAFVSGRKILRNEAATQLEARLREKYGYVDPKFADKVTDDDVDAAIFDARTIINDSYPEREKRMVAAYVAERRTNERARAQMRKAVRKKAGVWRWEPRKYERE